MATANLISMISQPAQMSYLCFETGGILDTCAAQLGEAVNDIPFQKLTDQVKTFGTMPGDPSRLRGDTDGILQTAQKFALATLRNEDRKTVLDSAVNSRQNIYFSKHANAASVISTIEGLYHKTSPAANPNLLELLSDLSNQQLTELGAAYSEDDRTGVVKAATSSLDTTTASSGTSNRAGKFFQESVGKNITKGTKLPEDLPLPCEGTLQGSDLVWPSGYESVRFIAGSARGAALTVGVNFEESTNAGRSAGSQSAQHVDYEYRMPLLEAQARNLRAQISLNDQKFGLFMFGQTIPHLAKIFQNELAAVDFDIYQLQIALLRTILTSPLPGVVTGIYKNPGDAVSAGEPVLRVEDNRVVHLIANLVSYDTIAIGDTATITTTLGGAAHAATTLPPGTVVAARGQGTNGRWEVVVKVNNIDGAGNFVLPLGYSFDPEYTTVTIA